LKCLLGLSAARWNVTNSNEDGLLGLGLDPDFAKNGYIYVYWSPVHETNPTQNILSRYKMTGDHVDVSSELRLLSINTQVGVLSRRRKECAGFVKSVVRSPALV
jgi:hypothetical protein